MSQTEAVVHTNHRGVFSGDYLMMATPVAVVSLDHEAIRARTQGDEKLLLELVQLFRESSQDLLAELGEAVIRGDAAQIRLHAHALLGTIANFSEGAAFETARSLQNMGRTGDLARAADALSSLQQQVKDLQDALEAWTGRAASTDSALPAAATVPVLARAGWSH